MLISAGLPNAFWVEAMTTAAYLINRCPSTALNFKTPEEVWSGHPPNYSRLRTFGCLAYAYIRQDKLEPRALKCIFLGYLEGVKAYKLWCLEPGYKKCIMSRDVIFNEVVMGNLADKSECSRAILNSDNNGKVQLEVEPKGVEDHETEGNDNVPDWSDQEAGTSTEQVDVRDYRLTRDIEKRQVKPPSKYDYANLIAFAFTVTDEVSTDEPKSYKEAITSRDRKCWLTAMEDEINSLYRNQTWRLVDKPHGQKIVGCKWIFKRKHKATGKLRYKARLVAQGFTQREGIDLIEVFSPVVKHRTITLMLSVVAQFNMELEQMDVKTAFLYGELKETIFMRQPEGFEVKGKESQVCLA